MKLLLLSYRALLSAAKRQPGNSNPFAWLGHYYFLVAKDDARAMQCYEKALHLAPGNAEAGKIVADIYVQRGEVCNPEASSSFMRPDVFLLITSPPS